MGIPLYISNEFMTIFDETDQRCITTRLDASLSTEPISPAQLGQDRFNCPMLTGKWKWSRAKGGPNKAVPTFCS